jgi:iron complex transport system ATP-binding protein
VRPPLVELRGVGFAYPAAGERRARPFRLADLAFEIGEGEIVGVIGPNSAGKTTLIRLLTRVLEPAAGAIVFEGRPLRRWGRDALARRVAVVPQGVPREFPFTVEELVLMGRYPHAPGRYFEDPADRAIARAAMEATGVADLAAQRLESLSGGERQRAVVARALAQEPRLLVLDEPTAHLDLRYQAQSAAMLRRLNRERGVTILLVSHDLNLAAEVCDRLLLMAEGRQVAVGPPEAVLHEALLGSAFGCEVTVDKHPTTRRPVVQLTWRVDTPGVGRGDTATTKGGRARAASSE